MTDKDPAFYVGLGLPADARVVEFGVQDGSSLRLWQRLYPLGTIAGVDHDAGSTWPRGTHRIVCSQVAPLLVTRLQAIEPAWDLVVDDASHDGVLTWNTFQRVWPLVEPDGWYVIEDWRVGHFNPGVYGRTMIDVARGLVELAERGDVAQLLITPELLAARRPA